MATHNEVVYELDQCLHRLERIRERIQARRDRMESDRANNGNRDIWTELFLRSVFELNETLFAADARAKEIE